MRISGKFKRVMFWLITITLLLWLSQVLIPHFVSLTATKTADKENSVKFLTYNVQDGLNTQGIDLILNSHADIIVLQEAYWFYYNDIQINSSQLTTLLSYDYFVSSEDHNADGYGLIILSKYEIMKSEFIKLSDAKNSRPRGLLKAEIKINNTEIAVFTTHLNLPNFYFNRLKQVKEIINNVNNSQPTVLLGDFNSPNSIFDLAYWRLFTKFHDTWLASGKTPFRGKTWHISLPVLRIDYILVNEYCTIVKNSASLIENPNSSDHKGVMVRLKF